MDGYDGVSMNIINDDRTPVRATAAAQGVNVARASVQLPDPNHWQTGLNSSIACDYQLFATESFAKKRGLKAPIQTFGEIILLSIPPKAFVPVLLGELNASDGKLKALKERKVTTMTVSNAKKTLSENTGQYHRILERWQKQFKQEMARLEGKVQLLKAERGHAVVRHAQEREALELERGEAETELATAREAHTVEEKRVLDKAASSKGVRN